jgi:organic hydroperoxide reductase OsmC/OhrA
MGTEPEGVTYMADIFTSQLVWAGAAKGATLDPATFSRDLNVTLGAQTLSMSSAPRYSGDPLRSNPEQLFVASLSACQALTYLFLAAKNHVAVIAYVDDAEGRLELVDGKMRMSRVTLRPRITVEAGTSEAKACELVEKAYQACFIANSVSARVEIEPRVELAPASATAR